MRAILNVVKNLSRRISEIESGIFYLRGLMDAVVPVQDGMPKTPSQKSKVDWLTARIVDAENELEIFKKILVDCRFELFKWLDEKIFSKEILWVMFRRYGLLQKFTEIAREMNFSESSIYRLHRTGLLRLGIHSEQEPADSEQGFSIG